MKLVIKESTMRRLISEACENPKNFDRQFVEEADEDEEWDDLSPEDLRMTIPGWEVGKEAEFTNGETRPTMWVRDDGKVAITHQSTVFNAFPIKRVENNGIMRPLESEEFDAVADRFKIAKSVSGNQWGIYGRKDAMEAADLLVPR